MRKLVLLGIVAGILTAIASSATIPVPVCPPNDPDACHIDKWPQARVVLP